VRSSQPAKGIDLLGPTASACRTTATAGSILGVGFTILTRQELFDLA
jgi:hypothetical protein